MRFPVVTSDNPKVKAWEKTVATEAKRAIAGQMFVGPIVVNLKFRLARPMKLKGVDVWHTTRPDLDKLARSTIDAMTGVCYADDGQVVWLHVSKMYANEDVPPCAMVRIDPAPGELQPGMF